MREDLRIVAFKNCSLSGPLRIFKVYDIVLNYVDCYEHALVILRSAKIQKETMDKLEK